jgi:2-polyprenyl-3-methyl-5-hydroxy-6-metoxy-1,4-benzoquinol methylase
VSARVRSREPSADLARDEFFDALRTAISASYLADPLDPYRGSGRSSGPARWEETRRCLVRALHKSGDFMDVGCANGLLLETLIVWARERGFALRPHGIDFVPELVELARQRHPGHRAAFAVANAFDWVPERRYDFVRTNLEYVPRADRTELVRRQHAAVAPGGRLIVCHYRNAGDEPVHPGEVAARAGFAVAGATEAPGVEVVWIDVP